MRVEGFLAAICRRWSVPGHGPHVRDEPEVVAAVPKSTGRFPVRGVAASPGRNVTALAGGAGRCGPATVNKRLSRSDRCCRTGQAWRATTDPFTHAAFLFASRNRPHGCSCQRDGVAPGQASSRWDSTPHARKPLTTNSVGGHHSADKAASTDRPLGHFVQRTTPPNKRSV